MGNSCWITAMARVIHYWQFPENGNTTLDFIDYEGYYWYCNYEELNLDYSLMPYELSENATQDEYEQTAKLFYACGAIGASIKVGWEGGIDSLPRVLNYYLNYDTTATVIRRWHHTKDEWIALFKNELDNGRPIMIAARTADSPAPWEPGSYEGHFFVCDGYNADDKFYINYSFGGIYGYYDIDSIDNFPAYHEALINDTAIMIRAMEGIKRYYYQLEMIDSARKLPALSKALVYALTKSSILYLRSEQTKQAEIFLNEALPLALKTNNTRQLTHIYFLLGDMFNAKDSIPQAIPYYYKAIALAEKHRYKYYLPFIYHNLFNIYFSNNQFDSSYKFQQKYMEVFRKKHNREMNLQIARLSAKYQIEQKVEVIDELTIINNQKKIIIANQRDLLSY